MMWKLCKCQLWVYKVLLEHSKLVVYDQDEQLAPKAKHKYRLPLTDEVWRPCNIPFICLLSLHSLLAKLTGYYFLFIFPNKIHTYLVKFLWWDGSWCHPSIHRLMPYQAVCWYLEMVLWEEIRISQGQDAWALMWWDECPFEKRCHRASLPLS